MQSLNPAGLPPDSRRISAMKAIISSGVENARWVAGEMQSSSIATPLILEISADTLAARQPAGRSGLGALADLEFDHLDLIVGGDAREFLRIERAVAVATTEISGTDLPDQIAAILAVIGTDSALAGVMREAALLGARVQCAHRVGTKRAETHRRDVEDRRRIRLGAILVADGC